MSAPFIVLTILGGLTLVGLAFVFLLIWIAKGEPDVNGDPERDAGWTDRELRLQGYLSGRRATIEAAIQSEILAGNQYQEAQERAALAEITALQIHLQTQR